MHESFVLHIVIFFWRKIFCYLMFTILFFVLFWQFTFRGMAGIQGPGYMGTGCIHRRKVLYGQSPDGANISGNYYNVQHFYSKYLIHFMFECIIYFHSFFRKTF